MYIPAIFFPLCLLLLLLLLLFFWDRCAELMETLSSQPLLTTSPEYDTRDAFCSSLLFPLLPVFYRITIIKKENTDMVRDHEPLWPYRTCYDITRTRGSFIVPMSLRSKVAVVPTVLCSTRQGIQIFSKFMVRADIKNLAEDQSNDLCC